jgi:hypothetical protein
MCYRIMLPGVQVLQLASRTEPCTLHGLVRHYHLCLRTQKSYQPEQLIDARQQGTSNCFNENRTRQNHTAEGTIILSQ